MSNLGAYQWITTVAKKVGGPVKLLILTALGGYVVVRTFEAGGKKVYRVVKESTKGKKTAFDAQEYVVTKEGVSNEGVVFNEGDVFIILEKDGDAVLINKFNDDNSPYFVSSDFLSEISDFA